jgi:general stress protein YciG
MCRPNERTHKHHIIPRYLGGSNEPENLVEVTITGHAMFHFCNYQLWSNEEDKIAWRAISGQINMTEAKKEAQVLNSKRTGQKCKENGIGVCGLTPEERSEAGRKGAQKCMELGLGIHAMTSEERGQAGRKGAQTQIKNNIGIFGMSFGERSELSKKTVQRHYENGTGIFGLTPEQRSERSRKSGQKNRENGTGIFGMTPEEKSEVGKRGGKKVSSQKWQCTVTGYVTNAGALSAYQKNRGIDTSNRIRIQ